MKGEISMLTLKLGTQQVTLNQRDAIRLIESMMLTIKNPAGAGGNELHLGELTLLSKTQPISKPVNNYSTSQGVLTNC
jgi:alpha-D-ribose 1-methylphosphonate 5-triphosphate synthase subunit PhnG